MNDWKPVATALLGSWPSQVATWGREALAAYLGELEARGVSVDAALVAIRSCGADQKFPPSAPELAALARRDPSRPTFEEAVLLIRYVLSARTAVRKARWEPHERFQLDRQAQLERSQEVHSLVGGFIVSYGFDQLHRLDIADEEYGQARRKQLREAWERWVDAWEGREVAAIASGRRDGLHAFDPLEALKGPDRPQIGAGS